MTIQTLFDRAMLADNQLDLIAGGDDVTRGLLAVNLVQDWMEAVAAQYGQVLSTYENISTTADQEYTTWPTDLERLDGEPWLLDSNGNPIRKITHIEDLGDHAADGPIFAETVNQGSGRPQEFSASGPGGRFLWTPTPDAVYSIRCYGLWAADDYTAAANTFAYPNKVALIVVPYMAKILRVGLDRDLDGVQAQAMEAFRPVIKSLRRPVHAGPSSRQYSEFHDT